MRAGRAGSVAEQPFPLVPAVAQALVLGLLIAARNAPRVTLGGLHIGPALVEPALLRFLSRSALERPALRLFAICRHRSSTIERRVLRAYHLPIA
jgi:hypothetical protein